MRSKFLSRYRLAFAGLACCLLTFISFPKPGISAGAWLALAPLLYFLREERKPWQNALFGFLSGIAANVTLVYWLFPMMHFNTGSVLQSVVCLLGLAGYMALYWGAWAWLTGLGRGLSTAGYALLAAASWVGLEYLRAWFLTGFPWTLLGYSQWNFLPLAQMAEVTGVYGVSFFLVGFSAAAAETMRTHRWKPLAIAGIAAVLLSLWGAWSIVAARRASVTAARVSVLQPSIDQYKKWDAQYGYEITATFAGLVKATSAAKADLVVWPETSVPGYLPYDSALLGWVRSQVTQSGTYHLVGTPYNNNEKDSYNATILFDPQGEIAGVHKKTHLVPFGEYVPLRKLLEPLFGILNTLGDFTPGRDYTLLCTPKVKIGATICSENFFGRIARRFVKEGAGIIVNQTNDAWYFKTSAADQHFIMNVFRAIENRRGVVVSGNTGVSGIVSPWGEISHRTGLFETLSFTGEVPTEKRLTFYTLHGDIFAKLSIIMGVLLLAAAWYKRRKKNI